MYATMLSLRPLASPRCESMAVVLSCILFIHSFSLSINITISLFTLFFLRYLPYFWLYFVQLLLSISFFFFVHLSWCDHMILTTLAACSHLLSNSHWFIHTSYTTNRLWALVELAVNREYGYVKMLHQLCSSSCPHSSSQLIMYFICLF